MGPSYDLPYRRGLLLYIMTTLTDSQGNILNYTNEFAETILLQSNSSNNFIRMTGGGGYDGIIDCMYSRKKKIRKKNKNKKKRKQEKKNKRKMTTCTAERSRRFCEFRVRNDTGRMIIYIYIYIYIYTYIYIYIFIIMIRR